MPDEETLRNWISKNAQNARNRTDYTQEKLAEALDVSSSTVSHLETGVGMVSVETLYELSLLLNIPFSDFFNEPSDSPEYPVAEESVTVNPSSQNNLYHIEEGEPQQSKPQDKSMEILLNRLTVEEKNKLKRMLKAYFEDSDD